MSPQIHETEHHGIPVRWVDVPGPLRGTLTFGVGHRDEPAHLRGVTHLTEHLVFRSMPDPAPWENGMSAASSLSFTTTGAADDVATFLNDLTRVLADPRFDERILDLERWVVEAEQPLAITPSAGLTTYRYGLGGMGNTHAGAPSTGSITVAEARDWITTWCTVDNARLCFSGPPPTSLDLVLPATSSRRHGRRVDDPVITRPTLVESSKAGVAMSLLVAPAWSYFVRDALEHVLIRELRTRRGLIYSIEPEITAIDGSADQLDLVLDPPSDLEETTKVAVAAIRSLAAGGADDRTVEVVRTQTEIGLAWDDVWFTFLESDDASRLRGIVDDADPTRLVELARDLTGESLAAVLRDSIDSLIVAVDGEECDTAALADELGLEHEPFGLGRPSTERRRGPGRTWRGRFGARDCWARLDGNRFVLHENDVTIELDLDDVVVSGRFSDGSLALIDRRGGDDVVVAMMYRKGDQLVSAILERVRPETVRDYSWHDDRPERPPAV